MPTRQWSDSRTRCQCFRRNGIRAILSQVYPVVECVGTYDDLIWLRYQPTRVSRLATVIWRRTGSGHFLRKRSPVWVSESTLTVASAALRGRTCRFSPPSETSSPAARLVGAET